MGSFETFLSTQTVHVPVLGFIINLFIVAALAWILGQVYVHHGSSLSNRRLFAKNFMLIGLTTMIIITIVKSSLALSLGLVGALSIVRFRSAIKEPEELAYLFLVIAIGLGLGADQRMITVVAFFIVCAFMITTNKFYQNKDSHNMYLSISLPNREESDLTSITEILKSYCSRVNLKRFDDTRELLETIFLVEFSDYAQIRRCADNVRQTNSEAKISFLDNKNVV